MGRITALGVLALALGPAAGPAAAADLGRSPGGVPPVGRFLATCEDLGTLCFVSACGRDQIEAALGCRVACPSSVVLTVVPSACPLPAAPPPVILRRRG